MWLADNDFIEISRQAIYMKCSYHSIEFFFFFLPCRHWKFYLCLMTKCTMEHRSPNVRTFVLFFSLLGRLFPQITYIFFFLFHFRTLLKWQLREGLLWQLHAKQQAVILLIILQSICPAIIFYSCIWFIIMSHLP